MVKAKVVGGLMNLESILKISDTDAEKIKNNPKRVKKALKDLGICHALRSAEKGQGVISVVGKSFNESEDIVESVNELKQSHVKFLDFIEELQGSENNEKTDEGDDKTLTAETSNDKTNSKVEEYLKKVDALVEEGKQLNIVSSVLLLRGSITQYKGYVPPMCAIGMLVDMYGNEPE